MKKLMRDPWKIITLVALLGGAVWIWINRLPQENTRAELDTAPQRGFLAPDFDLLDAEGKSYRLSQLRGQPVLLNFWASWCVPCRTEMPALDHIYGKYRTEGLLVLAINSTYQDRKEEAIKFTSENGILFPVVFDEDGDVARRYQVRALPSSFFIDSSGVIREIIIGGPMAEALLEIRVRQLFGDTD